MNREQFNESWLTEVPERIPQTELIDMLEYNIKDCIRDNQTISLVGKFKKIELNTVVYYWQEDKDKQIIIAGEFGKEPQCLVVHAVGKRGNRGRPPFASDLYLTVLSDQTSRSFNAILLKSDETMSDEGLGIWKRLLGAGHKISVYNKQNPGQSHIQLNSVEELDQFFSDERSSRQFQFILSENAQIDSEIRAQFLTRRLRELGGML